MLFAVTLLFVILTMLTSSVPPLSQCLKANIPELILQIRVWFLIQFSFAKKKKKSPAWTCGNVCEKANEFRRRQLNGNSDWESDPLTKCVAWRRHFQLSTSIPELSRDILTLPGKMTVELPETNSVERALPLQRTCVPGSHRVARNHG